MFRKTVAAAVCCCLGALASPARPQSGEKQRSAKSIGAAPRTPASRQRQSKIEQAKQMLEAGSRDQAIALLREVIREEPDDADAHLLLGATLALVPERSEAVKELQRAVELRPTFAPAYSALGAALARFAELDAARRMFEKAIELDPTFAEAHVNLALLLAQRKEFTSAREHFVRAIEIQGNSPQAAHSHYLLGLVYKQENELQKALRELELAVELRPSYAQAHLSLAGVRKELMDEEGALQAFKRAVELSPNDPSALYELGAAYLRGGKAPEAIKYLQKAWELKPANRPALYQLCRALLRAGRNAEAKACEQRLSPTIQTELAITTNVGTATDTNNEGVELERRGDLAAALEKYRAAVQLNPSQTVFRRNLALALCRLGRWEEGVAELKEVLKANPEDTQATKALYIALENVRAAKTTDSEAEKPPVSRQKSAPPEK